MSDGHRYITERLRNKAATSGTTQSVRSLMEEAVAVIENRDKGIAAAIAAEREACAKIADLHAAKAGHRASMHSNPDSAKAAIDKLEAAVDVAMEIRKRGQ
jgi:hypothetical protein